MHTRRLGARCLRPTWVTFFVQARAGDRRNRGCKGTQRFYGFSRIKTFSFKAPSNTTSCTPYAKYLPPAQQALVALLHAVLMKAEYISICLWKNLDFVSIYWMFVQKNITGQKRFFFPLYDHRTLRQKYRPFAQSNTKKLNGISKNEKCEIGRKWHIF